MNKIQSANIYNNGHYYRPNYSWLRKRARLYLRQLLRQVEVYQGQRILEVSCDQGQLTEQLRDFSSLVVGVDINAKAVEKSGKEYLQVMDAQALQFPDGSFDLVVSANTIEHIPDLAKAIHEFERVLGLGGFLILIYPWEPIRGMTILPEGLLIYRSLKVCRLFHIHKLTPRKIDHLIVGTALVQRNWKLFLGPHPMFISILYKKDS